MKESKKMLLGVLRNKRLLACLAIPLSLAAAGLLRVPIDQSALKEAERAARDAQQENNPAAAMRAYRHWLEYFPNEPMVQANLYLAMALAAEQSGETEQSSTWKGAALELDPDLERRIEEHRGATRGQADQWLAIFATAGQAAGMIQQARILWKQQQPQQVVPAVTY